jgi:transcription factor C subunit 6
MAAVKKGAVKKKAKGKGTDADGMKESAKEVIHEPLTRVTAVQWNPNPGYGCWAAVAMASGLVRFMDLGLEMEDSAD